MKKFVSVSLAVILIFSVHVYAGEVIYIPWTFEVYDETDFNSRMFARLDARSVVALEQMGDWALIETAAGWGWVNMRHTPDVSRMDSFFTPLGRNISVFYMNIETGYTYIHNPDRVYFAASISKSNHALYAYMLAERGITDIHAVHTYTIDDFWGGTGRMRFDASYGDQFTTRELLGLSIRESDNAAYRMLVRLFQNNGFSYRDFVSEIGADTAMIRDVIAQNTNARDAGLFMYSIYNYIESNSRFGHYLKEDLLNTAQTSHPHFTRWEGSNGVGGEVNISMVQSDYPFARKYGWAQNAFHEAGIVYAPSPYIIVILSNMERGAHDTFEEIGWFLQDFNHRTFVSPTALNAPIQGPEPFDGQTNFSVEDGFRLTIPVDFY
ncbi:MAG: class A beta-lactamase-related serine hydrolase [Clostridiales bacterium]|jgi:beta-lactamase class A|nr:class A beta-lactamase-related serine hydrolase [Clostridiales bacterium]